MRRTLFAWEQELPAAHKFGRKARSARAAFLKCADAAVIGHIRDGTHCRKGHGVCMAQAVSISALSGAGAALICARPLSVTNCLPVTMGLKRTRAGAKCCATSRTMRTRSSSARNQTESSRDGIRQNICGYIATGSLRARNQIGLCGHPARGTGIDDGPAAEGIDQNLGGDGGVHLAHPTEHERDRADGNNALLHAQRGPFASIIG